MKIITLGDSLTYGCWDEKGGWVARMRDYFQQRNLTEKVRLKRDWTWVFNFGISGITSTYISEQLKNKSLPG